LAPFFTFFYRVQNYRNKSVFSGGMLFFFEYCHDYELSWQQFAGFSALDTKKSELEAATIYRHQ
jgi:hypothetical protein